MNQTVPVVRSLQSVEPAMLKGSMLQSCSIPRITSGPLVSCCYVTLTLITCYSNESSSTSAAPLLSVYVSFEHSLGGVKFTYSARPYFSSAPT